MYGVFPSKIATDERLTTCKYPTFAMVVAMMVMAGVGSYMWVADLSHAYRQIRVAPEDSAVLKVVRIRIFI